MRTFPLFALLTALSAPALAMDKAAVEQVANKLRKGDAILIDVREADEIKDGMAAPAIWIATSEIKAESSRFKEIMKSLPKDKQIYVYCASGVRSNRFADELKKDGYKAENLGAYSDWRDAGKAVKPVADATAKPLPVPLQAVRGMSFDGPNIIAALIFSAVGFIYLRFGKRTAEPKFFVTGAVLLAYSYFTPTLAWNIGVGLLLSAVPFLPIF